MYYEVLKRWCSGPKVHPIDFSHIQPQTPARNQGAASKGRWWRVADSWCLRSGASPARNWAAGTTPSESTEGWHGGRAEELLKKHTMFSSCFVMFSGKQIPLTARHGENVHLGIRPSSSAQIHCLLCLVHLRSPWIKLVVWIPCDGQGWTRSHLRAGPVGYLQRSSKIQFPSVSIPSPCPQIKHDQTAKEKKIQLGSILNSNVYRTMSQWSLHHGGHSFTIPRQPQLTGPSTMKGASHLGCFSNLTQHQPTAQWEGASPTTIHCMSRYVSVYSRWLRSPKCDTHTVISNPRGSGFSGHQQYQDDNDVAISNPRIPKVSGHSNGPNTSENLWRRLMMHVLVQTPALQRWWKHLQCHIHQSCSGWVGPRIEESVAQIEISMRKMITKVDLSFFRCPIFRQASLLLWNQPLMRSPLGQRCRRHRTESWPGRLAEHLRLHQALYPSPVRTWSHLKYPQMVYFLMSQNASRCLASPCWWLSALPIVYFLRFLWFLWRICWAICSITPFEVLPDPCDTWPAPFANTTNTWGQWFILPAAKSVSLQTRQLLTKVRPIEVTSNLLS